MGSVKSVNEEPQGIYICGCGECLETWKNWDNFVEYFRAFEWNLSPKENIKLTIPTVPTIGEYADTYSYQWDCGNGFLDTGITPETSPECDIRRWDVDGNELVYDIIGKEWIKKPEPEDYSKWHEEDDWGWEDFEREPYKFKLADPLYFAIGWLTYRKPKPTILGSYYSERLMENLKASSLFKLSKKRVNLPKNTGNEIKFFTYKLTPAGDKNEALFV